MASGRLILYWDTSAVLSALFQDEHSEAAVRCARNPGVHLLSSLGWAESHAIIARIERERVVAGVLIEAARENLETGPWRRVNVIPDWTQTQALSKVWPLRGADLWHLAAAKNLRTDLPELQLLAFDARLVAAAEGEGCAYLR